MRRILIPIFSFVCIVFAWSANDNTSADAPSMGMGGTSVALENVYGNFNNQAILGLIEDLTVATSYCNRFSLYDARVMAAVPLSFGTIGVNISRYGSSLYSEMKLGAVFSRKFGDKFSAALQADILSIKPSEQEKSMYAFTAEIGLWAHPLENLTIGFHLYNFLNTEYKTLYSNESIPVNMKLGLGYTIFDNFLFSAEVENSSIYGTSVRAGMEYYIVDQVIIRTGGASNPTLASIGLGVVLGNFHIDVAGQVVRTIGKTGSISLSYAF